MSKRQKFSALLDRMEKATCGRAIGIYFDGGGDLFNSNCLCAAGLISVMDDTYCENYDGGGGPWGDSKIEEYIENEFGISRELISDINDANPEASWEEIAQMLREQVLPLIPEEE